jgi:DNA-binding beta-propeller fold protein YncE
VFPERWPPIVWPPPPDPPRIRYVGELTGQASLGRQPTGLDVLGAVLAGPPPMVAFVAPLAVAAEGSLVFVSDGAGPGGAGVHVLDLEQRTRMTFREAEGGPLLWPIDVVPAGGWLAVADARRGEVYMFTRSGRFVRTVGRGVLQRPSGLAWNAAAGELWVVDAAAHACLVFDAAGGLLRRIGRRGLEPGCFNSPVGVGAGVWEGIWRAVVADAMNFRVQVLAADGAPWRVFGQKGDAAGDLSLPRDAAVDSDGHIYVLDKHFENVQIFDREGRLLMAFGEEGSGPGQFSLPSSIWIDSQDRIWIADTYNRRVQVFQYLHAVEPAE